jgi:hypothetical protein
MPMLTSSTNSAVTFNSDFFDQAAINRLLTLRLPELPATVAALRISPLFDLPAFKTGDVRALFNADATQKALEESLSILMEDPNYREEIEHAGKDTLMANARNNLTAQLKTESLDAKVADNNAAARDSLHFVTDPNGVMALEVDGTRLFAVNPALPRGPSFALLLQIAFVVLDMFALVCTAIGILIEHGSGWVKQIAEYIKGIGQSMVDWAGQILGRLGTWISELRAAHGLPDWMPRVRQYANQIANFVIEAFRWGWQNSDFINIFRYCITCLLAGPWMAYYALQLFASIVLMIGTAGASIVIRLVLAAVQLAVFIWDTIELARILNPQQKAISAS